MTAYTYRMPSAFPGIVSRDQHSTIQPELMLGTAPLTAFGLPCIRDAATGRIRIATAGDTPASVVGFLVKPYPTHGTPGVDQLGLTVPNPASVHNLLRRGYIGAICNGNTAPSKDGAVYLRIATPSTGKPVGGIEAAADGANTIVIPNCVFMGPCDAQGNVELAYNI